MNTDKHCGKTRAESALRGRNLMNTDRISVAEGRRVRLRRVEVLCVS